MALRYYLSSIMALRYMALRYYICHWGSMVKIPILVIGVAVATIGTFSSLLKHVFYS